jgi:uncharacterized membrane protein YeaQ/YmgE (transglycosylase-associated protein family)
MDGLVIDYAGVDALRIACWIGIGTLAGLVARMIVRGRKLLGLWGDLVIGLLGVFLIGTLLRAFDFDLTAWLLGALPSSFASVAIWIDIAISGLVGALLIRLVLRPFTGRG